MTELEIAPGCWNANTGSPMAFLQWRALIGRAAGFEMEMQSVDGVFFEAPVLPLAGVTEENALGIWEPAPDNIVLVLLIHMADEGIIEPAHAGLLADELQGFIDGGSLDRASYAAPDSIARHVERMRTEQFITGLRFSAKSGEKVTFYISGEEDD